MKTNTLSAAAVLDALSVAQVEERLRDLERERRALLVLLRAVKARTRGRQSGQEGRRDV